jgi:hypothetical protein
MNGPKLWADMLTAINIPGAVVAGGCIRDCFLSLEPKDIDICIPATSSEELYDIVEDLIARGVFNGELMERKEYEADEEEDGELFGVASGEMMGFQVDLIARKVHLDGVQALIESFDFGFVQMAFSIEDGLVCTPANVADRYTKRYTMQHDRHVEQSIGRWLRFNNRHPGLLALDLPFEYQLPCTDPTTL